MEVDLDLGYAGIVGQGRRSRSNANIVFDITVTLLLGQGQRSGSRLFVKVKGQGKISGAQRSILGAQLCRVQQRAIRVITGLRCLSVCLLSGGIYGQ